MTQKHQVHHSYLTIPKRFQSDSTKQVIYKKNIHNKKGDHKFESDRSKYITSILNYKDKTVLDIGCNTGYFAYAALDEGAAHVTGYEGCPEAGRIIKTYSTPKDNFILKESYYDFNKKDKTYDVIHLLNVMHHVGRDFAFDKSELDLGKLHDYILKTIDDLADMGNYLVFQIGYNQKGDITKPLFNSGTKEEQINFIKNGLSKWSILNIGIPVRDGLYIKYVELDNENMSRDDTLGEFLNRPIFILKKI